ESFGADSASAPLPGVWGKSGGTVVDGGVLARVVGEFGGFRDGHHVGEACVFQMVAQAGVLAELLVRGEPCERHAPLSNPVDHGCYLLRPGAEGGLSWVARLGPPSGFVEHR